MFVVSITTFGQPWTSRVLLCCHFVLSRLSLVIAMPGAAKSSNPPPRLLSRLSEARFSFKLRKSSSRLLHATLLSQKEHSLGATVNRPQERQEEATCRTATSTASLGIVRPISSLTSSLTSSLLPLSFAQSRRDIRERKEGFEMSRSADPIPFAIRTQTLLPLDIAYAREDIRRRDEQFQSTHTLDNIHERRTLFPDADAPRTPTTSVSHPSVLTGESSPSVYSQSRSWIDLSALDDSAAIEDSLSFESLVAVYSSRSLQAEAQNADASSPRRILASASSGSFDEESFMRMAESVLGW
ncbi:hypothetical protein OH77DRAFT_1418586 [Trametes cingulata]|nr:hypothetical protein OH77DRAFT_1418586 [Trametes cingulata]